MIPGSPAFNAGIEKGDVILFFNDEPVNEMRNLPRIVAGTEIGKKVPVVIWRKGKKMTLSVAVGELKEEQASVTQSNPEQGAQNTEESEISPLGLKLAPVNKTTRKKYRNQPIND